jgi:F-type H+-transporting ATPase subunit delta
LKKSPKKNAAKPVLSGTAAADSATPAQDLRPIFHDLEVVESSLHSSLKMRGYFENPRIPFAEKVNILRNIFKDYISEAAYDFVLLLIQANAIYLLTDILRRYRLKKEDTSVLELEVRTAIPLSPEEKDKLAERFAKKFGRHLTIRNVIDESIVAGMIVKTGDLMIDASLQTKMTNLIKKLRKG